MAKGPEMTQREGSSLIAAHSYNPHTRELTVSLKNGSTHIYEDVSLERVEAFEGAASPGKYFNDQIKGNHASRRVR